jgi:hypothetical protein
VDNLFTGREQNVAQCKAEHPEDFQFVNVDVSVEVCDLIYSDAAQDATAVMALSTLQNVVEIYNLACPASPPHYQVLRIHRILCRQKDPLFTLRTAFNGTDNLLRLAQCGTSSPPTIFILLVCQITYFESPIRSRFNLTRQPLWRHLPAGVNERSVRRPARAPPARVLLGYF